MPAMRRAVAAARSFVATRGGFARSMGMTGRRRPAVTATTPFSVACTMTEPMRDERPVHHDFRLQERDDATGAPRPSITAPAEPFVAARDALRAAWTPPRDTFVTEDLPVLLTRLNLVAPRDDRRPADEADDR